jgi:hypothetical protein
MALSTCTPVWLDKVQQGYNKDDKTQKIISALLVALGSMPYYTWTDGLLRYKKRIWTGINAELQQQILQAKNMDWDQCRAATANFTGTSHFCIRWTF